MARTCEGIVPESVTPHIDDETGELIQDTIDAHPCLAPATMLARSMVEVTCSEGVQHWRWIEDHVWCGTHYIPGVMTHLDGSVSAHAAMLVEDYREG